MDTLSPLSRHLNMSHIRAANTKPELEVRSALHRLGFRFRKNDSRLSGKPDIVFPHYHAVIFVNGCFWHAHDGCANYRLPKSNTEYWQHKLERNRERDAQEIQKLQNEGWRVGVVWECSITGKRRAVKIASVAEEISLWLEEELGDFYREF
jgi:DNA mismatch endonuclease, patch repair protein